MIQVWFLSCTCVRNLAVNNYSEFAPLLLLDGVGEFQLVYIMSSYCGNSVCVEGLKVERKILQYSHRHEQ